MSDDTAALAALRREITTDWTVVITDHEHSLESRDLVAVTEVREHSLTLVPARPWLSQGRKFPFMIFAWDDPDMEVTRRTVRLYHTPPPHTGKYRRLIKTLVFYPPAPH